MLLPCCASLFVLSAPPTKLLTLRSPDLPFEDPRGLPLLLFCRAAIRSASEAPAGRAPGFRGEFFSTTRGFISTRRSDCMAFCDKLEPSPFSACCMVFSWSTSPGGTTASDCESILLGPTPPLLSAVADGELIRTSIQRSTSTSIPLNVSISRPRTTMTGRVILQIDDLCAPDHCRPHCCTTLTDRDSMHVPNPS
jgi:hypothetical protein